MTEKPFVYMECFDSFTMAIGFDDLEVIGD